jgi:hypothetical protein
MNIKFHMHIKLNNELIQLYFKPYNNKCLDESQKIRAIIWMEQSNGDEIYE